MTAPISGGEGSRKANVTPPSIPIRVHTLHQAAEKGLLR